MPASAESPRAAAPAPSSALPGAPPLRGAAAPAAATPEGFAEVTTPSSELAGVTALGDDVRTEFVAECALPTPQGEFRVRAYRAAGSLRVNEPVALVSGETRGREGVLVRVHDQCVTSEVFGSLRCDCREQLDLAKAMVKQQDGVVIYLPQEGRGIGLANKIAVYAAQLGAEQLDTVDANRRLGFPDDMRSYETAAAILQDLGIQSIRLLSNNPRKRQLLEELGVAVAGLEPCIVDANEHNAGYLDAKQRRMAHLLAPSPRVGPGSGPSRDRDRGEQPGLESAE